MTRLLLLLLVVAGVATWANSLGGAFVFDDHAHIVEREGGLSRPWPLTNLLESERRPLVKLTLAANYAISGLEPWSYHVLNVLVHLAATLVLFDLVRRSIPLVTDAVDERHAAWIAFATALLWSVHPLQTESVTYVIQRAESMGGLAILIVLYGVARGAASARAWPWYTLSVVACAAGLGSKGTVVVAPLLAFLFDALIVARSTRGALRARWALHLCLAATWLVLLPTGLLAAIFDTSPDQRVGVGFGVRSITPLDYLVSQPAVVLHYLRLVAWPDVLCIDYRWPKADSVAVLPAIALGALLLATLVATARRHWTGFVGLSFFLLLVPTSSFIPLRDLAVEHRMYLPLAAPVLLVVVALARVGRAGIVVVLLVAAALVARTVVRNSDYADPAVLWSQAIAVNDDNWRARMNHALAVDDVAELAALADRYPQVARLRYNYGNVLADSGDLEGALPHLRVAAKSLPSKPTPQLRLAEVLRDTGRPGEAVEFYRRAADLQPREARIRVGLANALTEDDRLDEAARVLQDAIRIADADDAPELAVSVRFNLANTYFRQGAWSDAATVYEQVLDLSPDHAEAQRWLDESLLRKDEAGS